ncbi:hypothetical protein HHI36_013111 [Cryptolaemus montrouzieri]|uniref:Uncharacterized protein n=1 Tax=Cryptolaemus montrouzieri TaxID=559131 RepID=A0ABD2NGC8_9CUCU
MKGTVAKDPDWAAAVLTAILKDCILPNGSALDWLSSQKLERRGEESLQTPVHDLYDKKILRTGTSCKTQERTAVRGGFTVRLQARAISGNCLESTGSYCAWSIERLAHQPEVVHTVDF